MKELSKEHSITLVCEKRDNQSDNDVKEVEKICGEVIWVKRKKQWSFFNVARTGFSAYPFLMIGHTQAKITEKLYEVLSRKKFDLIHVETFYVFQNLPQTSLPVVLVEHNIEYIVYKRYAAYVPFFARIPLYFDILKLKYWEEQFWKKAAKVVAVSETEKKIIGREDTEVVPNGVDVEKFKVKSSKPKVDEECRILFIGDFRWVKNVDALYFVLKEVWPIFLRQNDKSDQNVILWIVGRNIQPKLKKMAGGLDNIIIDENSNEPTEEIFRKADILLAPIRVGGGTSFKILEAMASGIPVITTPIGVEGMAVGENEIVVADNAEKAVLGINRLLGDFKFYKKIQTNARKIIEKEYNWKNIAEKLGEVYKSVTND